MEPQDQHRAPRQEYTYEHPRPAVTADTVLFTFREDSLQALLIRRGQAPFADSWALPGGFVEMDEDLETVARRELAEETNVRDVHLEQLRTFGAPDRDPRGRVITVAHLAVLSPEQVARTKMRSASDARDVAWWGLSDLPDLAFDHARIVECGLRRLHERLQQGLDSLLLPEEFTLSEMRKLHEAVMGETLDKRAFRRKALARGVLEDVGQRRTTGHGSAKLYRFLSAFSDGG